MIREDSGCNECGRNLSDGDSCYCERCYDELADSRTSYEEENDRLTNRIAALEAEIKRLQEIVGKCTHCGGSYSATKM